MNDETATRARWRHGTIALVFFVAAYLSGDLLDALEAYQAFWGGLPEFAGRLEQPLRWCVFVLVGLAVAHKMPPWKAPAELGMAVEPLRAAAVSFVACLPMLVGFAIFAPRNAEFTLSGAILYSGIFPLAEEVLFRGYAFGQLQRRAGLNLWVAAVGIGAVFGLAHLGNASVQALPLSGEIGTVLLIGVGGALYAWLFVRWDYNLWVPFGMHLFMNLWWDVFDVAQSPLGGWFPNVMRLLTVILIILLTIYRKRIPWIGDAVTRDGT